MLLRLQLVFSRGTLMERVGWNSVFRVNFETQLGQDWLEDSTVPQGRGLGGRGPRGRRGVLRRFLCACPCQPPAW